MTRLTADEQAIAVAVPRYANDGRAQLNGADLDPLVVYILIMIVKLKFVNAAKQRKQ